MIEVMMFMICNVTLYVILANASFVILAKARIQVSGRRAPGKIHNQLIHGNNTKLLLHSRFQVVVPHLPLFLNLSPSED